MKTCDVDGCERAARSGSAAFCGMHYRRWLKHGDPLATLHRVACEADGCAEPHYGHGWCQMHYWRLKRHGSLEERPRPTGPEHPGWKGDDVTYEAAHLRLKATLGKANSHLCVDCFDRAQEWSYDGSSANEQRCLRRRIAYSTDPAYYVPRCISCHRKHDLGKKVRT